MESKYSYPAQTTCDKCGDDVRRFKFLKKMNGGRFCKKCARKKRLEHREFLKRDICHIPKREEIVKGYSEKRKEKEKLMKTLGFDSKTANERIDNLCEKMRKVVEKLRETVKSEEDLNKRFREEFGKMCMELESGELR